MLYLPMNSLYCWKTSWHKEGATQIRNFYAGVLGCQWRWLMDFDLLLYMYIDILGGLLMCMYFPIDICIVCYIK